MGEEIFVMAEHREGEVEEPSFSLLSEARRLNENLGGSRPLSAILVGYNVKDPGNALGRYGVNQVYLFDHPLIERYQPELYTDVITRFLEEKAPEIFLLADTSLGSDLAPRIAARLRASLVTHCVDLIVNDGRFEATKPVSDQYLYQKIVFRSRGLKMVTFSTGSMVAEELESCREARVIRIPVDIDEKQMRSRSVEFIRADPESIGLDEADRIVCGGRGAGKKTFEIVFELADSIKGSVGGTRPIIDWGILPQERQIGQTGVDVLPTLLITCGVSGANEFTTGMERSKWVVVINKDRKARIFKFADLGIVGDLHQIIPLVVDQIKKKKRRGP